VGRARRLIRNAALFWLLVAFVVWNALFDVLVSRGEKQYFLSQAHYELGLGPRVTIDEVMSRTIRDAVRSATLLAGFVLAAGVGSAVLLVRRRGADTGPGDRH
jgi:hypothetical protein